MVTIVSLIAGTATQPIQTLADMNEDKDESDNDDIGDDEPGPSQVSPSSCLALTAPVMYQRKLMSEFTSAWTCCLCSLRRQILLCHFC